MNFIKKQLFCDKKIIKLVESYMKSFPEAPVSKCFSKQMFLGTLQY